MASLKGVKGGTNNITKTDLVDFVAQDTGLTKKDTKTIIDSIFSTIPQITKSGGYITIGGFGTFKEVKTKARTMKLSAKQRKAFKTSSKTKRISAKKRLTFSSSKTY